MLTMNSKIYSYSLPTEVVIGFDPEFYRVSEDEGTVTLTVRLLGGVLQTNVSILFSTNSESAVGKLL